MKNNIDISWIKKQKKEVNKMLKPRLEYDKSCDMFYLWFGGEGKIDCTIEATDNIRFDINKQGVILGVEIEDLKKQLEINK